MNERPAGNVGGALLRNDPLSIYTDQLVPTLGDGSRVRRSVGSFWLLALARGRMIEATRL